jgi:SanA protein
MLFNRPMKTFIFNLRRISFLTRVLAVGDSVLLAGFGFYLVYFQLPGQVSPSQFNLNLAVSILPFVLTWLMLGPALGHFDVQPAWGEFLLKVLQAWCLTFLLSETFVGIYRFVSHRIQAILIGLIFPFVFGLVCLLAWRIVFKGFYALSTQKRFPFLNKATRWGLVVLTGGAVGVLLLRLFWVAKFSSVLFSVAVVHPVPTAIVFGAGVYPDGTPSRLLVERINVAAELFQAGKVKTVLLSGDGRPASYDEPQVMAQLAESLGLPRSALILDPLGYNTYTSCYRARNVYGLRQAILVSQSFHLTRALLICTGLGVESVGVPAAEDQDNIQSAVYWNMREIPATLLAWGNVYLFNPVPDF